MLMSQEIRTSVQEDLEEAQGYVGQIDASMAVGDAFIKSTREKIDVMEGSLMKLRVLRQSATRLVDQFTRKLTDMDA